MPSAINIKIGDITIAVEANPGQFEFAIPQAYRNFICDGRVDIHLGLHQGSPQHAMTHKIFGSSPIWSLYRCSAADLIHIFEEHADLRRLLVLPPRSNRAELYFAKPDGRFIDPFFGPVMELLMINHLARGHGVVIHACGIAYLDQGLLFAGESGAGKSTLAHLWNCVDGATVLSDDRTLVRQIDGEFRMYGTPWHGEAKFGSSRGVELKKIFFLRHAQKNALRPISVAGSVVQLLQSSFPPHWDATGMNFTMALFEDLASRVPCLELLFEPDDKVIETIKSCKVE